MASRDLATEIFFLSQTVLGILGNSTLLCCFIISNFTGIKAKPTDLIVKHLTCSSIMVLLFKGIPQTMTAFGQTYFLDDFTCKLVFYFHRVARGVSLGSTSLLSVFQFITISPGNSKWAQLKVRIHRIVGPSLGLCWTIQLLVYVFIPIYTTDIWSVQNVSGVKEFGYCAVVNPGRIINILNVVFLTFNDVMFLGLMMWASGSMVFILIKHKQRVEHIHKSLSPRSSLETRATQSILILVSTFVVFYVISIVLTFYLSVMDVTFRWLTNANLAMSACFPAFCPFLLLRHYISVFRLCCACSYQTTHCACGVREH
ncbi:vomeronasal type-1 receptor 4-like [Arvicanthis niloticus]|uniref:vomeronasal type-1 receptor 4-like n=1 Tax=Arvicanthis niloticus TaxID=61156 RepID=UPI001485CFCD|nr:vomeronasal type-1 receptor 4-like [Arvicanthis niloticus]